MVQLAFLCSTVIKCFICFSEVNMFKNKCLGLNISLFPLPVITVSQPCTLFKEQISAYNGSLCALRALVNSFIQLLLCSEERCLLWRVKAQ